MTVPVEFSLLEVGEFADAFILALSQRTSPDISAVPWIAMCLAIAAKNLSLQDDKAELTIDSIANCAKQLLSAIGERKETMQ